MPDLKASIKQNIIKATIDRAGPRGAQGETGEGLVSGGSTSQVLRKASNTNFDTEWHSPAKSDIGLGSVDNTSDAGKPISTAQQTALDAKLDTNTPISGATKTKITYDADGLVTAGANATTADIADSTDKRYVTDAELTVLGNTTGTNSGNETTTSVGALINGATGKATPIDADYVGLMDSAASNILKKLSWANVKATLKTYFDTLYPSGSGTSSGTNTGDQDLSGYVPTSRTVNGQALSSNVSLSLPADIVVASSGGDYTDIQSGLDNVAAAGGTIFVKGTHTITTGLLVKVSNTRLIFSGGAVVQCNGANVATLIKPNSTSLSRIEVRGGKWLQTNATAQGVAFDFSDCPNSVIAPTRIEEFGTAIKVTDTTSTSFYSHYLDIQIFNCNNGLEISGSQANFNLWESIRIRPKAGGAGKGISLVDARGNTFINCNSEPATGTGITGINIDATSRDNQFIGCWIENNALGVNVESGANNNQFYGGSITSNSTDITDAGTNTVFDGVNKTGTKLYQKPKLTVVDDAYDATTWNGSLDVPTKNAIRDKIEATLALTDGDKGDITVSSSGTAWAIDNDVVTYAKIQNVSATDKLLGRSTAGAGDIEEIALTAAGRALIDDTDASAQRTTLGLGSLATQSGTFSGTSSGTNTGDQTSVSGNAGTATALATSRNIDGQGFDGTGNITVIAPGTHAATGKTTPADADELPLVDSAASNVLKKLTWANLKATLKTYFDTLYYIVGGTDVDLADGGTGASTAAGARANLLNKWVVQFACQTSSPLASQTYYLGFPFDVSMVNTTAVRRQKLMPFACTLRGAAISVIATVGGSSDAMTVSARINNTTDVQLSNAVTAAAALQTFSVTGLSQAISAGDLIEIKVVTPAWSTAPTTVRMSIDLYFE